MKHIETLKQALEALEWEEAFTAYPGRFLKNNITALRQAIAEAEEQAPWDAYDKAMAEQAHPIGWLYAEGLEALKMGKCWTAYGTKQDGDCSIPIYLNDAVAPKAEPRASESGAGFESLPASPNAEQAQPVAWLVEFESGDQELHFEEQAVGDTNTPLYTAPPPRKPLTDEMVVAAARMLSDRQAAACNVDCGDMWKMHGNDFIEDARAALEAAHGIKENT
jgi:hypothetical protein